MHRIDIRFSLMLAIIISAAPAWSQATYEDDMARQAQHAYEENMRARQAAQPPQQSTANIVQGQWISSFTAFVTHPDAAGFWAVTNVRTKAEAETIAVDNCAAAMGEGCSVWVSGGNGYLVVATAEDGRSVAAIAGSARQARSDLERFCKLSLMDCRFVWSLPSLPWREPANWTAEQQQFADQELSRRRVYSPAATVPLAHVMLATPIGLTDRGWDDLAWITSGPTYTGVRDTVLKQCRQESGVQCKISQIAIGRGVIVQYGGEGPETYYVAAPSLVSAPKLVRNLCAEAHFRCKIRRTFDTSDEYTERVDLRDAPPPHN